MNFQDFKEELDRDISGSETFFEKIVGENDCDECRKELVLHRHYVSGIKRLASDSEGLADLTHLLAEANNVFEGRQGVSLAAFFRDQSAVAAAFIFGIC